MASDSISRQVKHKASINRINSLPNDLLAKILSSLSTKEAVATSVLSKRWKLIYTLITNLDLDDSLSHCLCNRKRNMIIEDRASTFSIFVDNVLQKYQSGDITSYRLKFGRSKAPYCSNYHFCLNKCYPVLDPKYLNTWMCFPLSRGVRELDLCTRLRDPGKLPFALFRCQTLQVLKLDVNHDLELPKSFCLPNLKVFHLTLLCFPVGNFITRLLSKCPLLEDLALIGDWEVDHPIHIISAPSLRRLAFSVFKYKNWHRCEFVLDAPNLEYLAYDDSLAIRYSVGELNSLVEAHINTEHSIRRKCEVIYNLVRRLCNVQRLHLGDRSVAALQHSILEHNKLPMFRNLNHLELGIESFSSHKVLVELLDVSPFLEALIFVGMINFSDEDDNEYKWSKTERTPSCLKFSLKRIVIPVLEWVEAEQALTEYFLRRASVLEELLVVCNYSNYIRLPMAHRMLLSKKIQEMPRQSNKCSIIVV